MTPNAARTTVQRLRAAVEFAPAGLLMVDRDGRIVLVNREVERLFGYPRAELLGQSVEILVPERFRSSHPAHRAAFFAEPAARAVGADRELFGARRDGSEVPVEIGLTPVETDEGLFTLAAILDISARKRAEDDRRRLEQLLRQSQKLEAVGTLAAGIAHDFNNVLAAIVGYAELIAPLVIDRQAQADVADLLKAAQRGKQLVERIQAFTRPGETARRPVALDQVVREALALLRSVLPASVEIGLDLDRDVPSILADAGAVQQIVTNLATNAVRAMPSGGRLDIRLEALYVRDSVARAHPQLREGPHAVLTVRDTGHGMDAVVRERALEPFFTTKRRGTGSGLGLAVVHKIVQDHRGAIELESETGRGTTVRCLFPAADVETIDTVTPPIATPRGAGQHVLYVDDEPPLIKVVARRLTALGYRVTTRTHPSQALKAFRADPQAFDLVITDYSMPELDGVQLAHKLTEIRDGIPILLLAGYVEDLDPAAVAAAGISRLLQKPVTSDQLGQAVQELLHAAAHPVQSARPG